MEDHKPISLAAQAATIKVSKDETYTVIFGPDVTEIWASGRNLDSSESPVLHPEITGRLKTDNDYSHIKDAELILEDKRVFKISFHDRTHFFAHESVDSRTRVYE